jgi:hypothetical protein
MSVLYCVNLEQLYLKDMLAFVKKFVTQSRTGLQIYEGHDDQLSRPGPMA